VVYPQQEHTPRTRQNYDINNRTAWPLCNTLSPLYVTLYHPCRQQYINPRRPIPHTIP